MKVNKVNDKIIDIFRRFDRQKTDKFREEICEYYKYNRIYTNGWIYTFLETFDDTSHENSYSFRYEKLPFILQALGEFVENNEYSDIKENLFKLQSDLGFAYQLTLKFENIYKYNQMIFRDKVRLRKELDELKRSLKESQTEIETLTIESNKIREQNKNMTGQFVSILGIFSAVVLAFNGGFSMITSALQALENSSIYRITFLITLMGFILFNTIMVLLVAISKFNTHPISSKCSKSNKCFEGGCPKSEHPHTLSSYHCKLKTRYPYAYYINATLLIIAYLIVGIHLFIGNTITDKPLFFDIKFLILLSPILIILIVGWLISKMRNIKNK